jgi:SAM-dependent methyltransferase
MTNRLLDVGCGAGFFLDEARARGWRVCGTEYSERALALARGRGHEVTQAPVAVDGFEANSFDVVTAFEVFEHVKDPLSEAAVLARVLRPGGLLYCTTPNFNSVSRRALGPGWSVIEYPEHLWYFTPRTLRRWLERSGFVTQSIESSGISLSRLQSAGRRTETGAASWTGTDERVRSTIEHSRLLRIGKAGANHLLSAVGAGDTLKGRFRRDSL